MATINLRPWREERRERLKKEFIQVSGLVLVGALACWFGWNQLVSGWTDYQKSRNDVLSKEIVLLDKKVEEIKTLRDKKADLIARMGVIQGLQGTRPKIVYIFDQMAKTVPEGVFYRKVELKDRKISVSGSAESSQRVSALMRNLDESEWFENPNLSKMVANTSIGEQASDFNLTFDISKGQSVSQ
jgi:type IV pilus assembly protein PilN